MFWPKSLIRPVSLFAAMMLVWCQTAAATQGFGEAPATPATESVSAAPCHEATSDHGSETHQQCGHTRCQCPDASFETAKVAFPDIDGLMVTVLAATIVPTATPCASPNNPPIERAAPPPLLLVYCRLLI
jgi:hypothetical protein